MEKTTSAVSSSGPRRAVGYITLLVIAILVVFLVRAWGDSYEQAEASVSAVSTTVTTEALVSSTTLQEVDKTTTTTESIPGVVEEQIVVMNGSFEPKAPPEIKPPVLIEVDPDIKVGTALVTLRSGRLIDESGSREELTVKYSVDIVGNLLEVAQFTPDYEAYKMQVYLPASHIEVASAPSDTFEWDGQVETYPAQIVEMLSDGTVGELLVLPADAAIAYKNGGKYYLSEPIQTLLFRAAESSVECVAMARDSMRRIYMDAVYSGYENDDGTSRELIEEVIVSEVIEVHEFSTDGIAEAMLKLGGGVWEEFELVSVTCGGE